MNMFKFEFNRLLKGSIIWALVCSALVVMFMLFFPSMKNMGMQELVGSKLELLPEAFLEAFNISGATDFSNISDFSAYVLQYIIMAGGVYAAILGVSALVKEESEGTIEFLYSKPVTRSKIVTAKILASIVIFFFCHSEFLSSTYFISPSGVSMPNFATFDDSNWAIALYRLSSLLML